MGMAQTGDFARRPGLRNDNLARVRSRPIRWLTIHIIILSFAIEAGCKCVYRPCRGVPGSRRARFCEGGNSLILKTQRRTMTFCDEKSDPEPDANRQRAGRASSGLLGAVGFTTIYFRDRQWTALKCMDSCAYAEGRQARQRARGRQFVLSARDRSNEQGWRIGHRCRRLCCPDCGLSFWRLHHQGEVADGAYRAGVARARYHDERRVHCHRLHRRRSAFAISLIARRATTHRYLLWRGAASSTTISCLMKFAQIHAGVAGLARPLAASHSSGRRKRRSGCSARSWTFMRRHQTGLERIERQDRHAGYRVA